MSHPRFLACALCALSLTSVGIACAADAPAPPNPAPPAKTATAQSPIRVVRDANDKRTIAVVTDREESVADFFGRNRLVLVDNANDKGKKSSVAQIVAGDAGKFFTSYPLPNDQDFRLYRYGDYYELATPTKEVAALFPDDLASNWKNTILILAPSPESYLDEDSFEKKATLVGVITLKGDANWRAEDEVESLKYRAPEAAKPAAKK